MNSPKITACLVVYNEESVIERCLASIKDLVDEIIVVHDGECADKTLEICSKYTDKVFIRPHIGIAEPHRSFTYEKSSGDWIFQVDADEFIDAESIPKIRDLISSGSFSGYEFRWELWDGKKQVYFNGLRKLCLFRKGNIKYQGIPQTVVSVDKRKFVDVVLHHKPKYENTSWKTFNKKRKYWLQSHVKYFFPEEVSFECFNDNPDSWVEYTKKVRRHPLFYTFFYPLKNLFGQLRNGLWRTWIGVNIALQQYVYYFDLYWSVWQEQKRIKTSK
jgi:glycosyltransferase involved in cell wall biosynthesis